MRRNSSTFPRFQPKTARFCRGMHASKALQSSARANYASCATCTREVFVVVFCFTRASAAGRALILNFFNTKFARFSTGKLRDFGVERAVRMQKTCADAQNPFCMPCDTPLRLLTSFCGRWARVVRKSAPKFIDISAISTENRASLPRNACLKSAAELCKR